MISTSTANTNIMESDSTDKTIPDETRRLQKYLLRASIDKIRQILSKNYGAKLSSHKDEIQKCKEIVDICLDLKLDVNIPESKCSTLLHFVAKKLDAEIFQAVLNRSTGFNINSLYVDSYESGKALLHILVEEGNENLVKLLLDFGADVNVKDAHQETALFYAVFHRKAKLVRLLQDSGGTIHYANFTHGFHYPLELWCTEKEIVKILLEGGCNVRPVTNGLLPINKIFPTLPNVFLYYEKKYYDRWEIVKLLCEHGADISLRNKSGSKILHFFCSQGLLDDVYFSILYGADLLSREYGRTALHGAVFGNNFDLIELFLRYRFDLNVKDSINGETPLHRLSKVRQDFYPEIRPELRVRKTKEYVEMVEFLVDNFADVDALDNNCMSPLEKSISWNSLEISEAFLELKADVTFRNCIFHYCDSSIVHLRLNNECKSTKSESLMLLIAFLAMRQNDICQCDINDTPVVYLKESKSPETIFEQCKMEVKQMKRKYIYKHRNISFFEFLVKDLMDVLVFCRSEEVMLVLESQEYKKEFPLYGYLLEKRIERVELFRKYINAFSRFSEKFIKKSLPFDVLIIIFNFLESADLRNFARALMVSKDFPNGKYYIR